MSRNLYVASEGSPFIGYNTEKGGYVGAEYSFPNSAANADTLLMLRNALVMEELQENVETGKLYLLSGAPRAWFEPGKAITSSSACRHTTAHVIFRGASRTRTAAMTGDIHLPRDAGCNDAACISAIRARTRH